MKRPAEVVLSAVCGFVASALMLALAITGVVIVSRGGESYELFTEAWRWSPSFHITRALLSAIIYGVTGVYMLAARRWARNLFVVWSLLQLVLDGFTGPHFRGGWSAVSFIQIIVTLVLAYLLLTGSSQTYFEDEMS
jgi:hypothetical protein